MNLFKEYFICFEKGFNFAQVVLSNWLYLLYRLYLLGKKKESNSQPHLVLAVEIALIPKPSPSSRPKVQGL